VSNGGESNFLETTHLIVNNTFAICQERKLHLLKILACAALFFREWRFIAIVGKYHLDVTTTEERTMMKSMIAALVLSAALGLSGAALADKGGTPNDSAANGQAHSGANCVENIAKQDANGQTGANTGSANDSKQANTAVTNCDGFWN
jgi:hypothetical protein